MIQSSIKFNTRYAETDQMGVIHHANYLIYMEQGRVKWLDELGFSYDQMEKDGVMLPVYNIDINYKLPIYFEEEITVLTTLKKMPTTKVIFDYQILNSSNKLCAQAELTLVFTDAKTFRPRRPLEDFVEKCRLKFE